MITLCRTGIEVSFFDDRLEIRSPGQLLSTINVSDIEAQRGVHESRNSLIARVLRESTLMRELGEGFQRIFKALADHELDRPGIVSEYGRFSVVIRNKSVFNAKQEAWLSLFEKVKLTKVQKKIVVLGMEGREISPNDIFGAIGSVNRDIYDREVTSLRKSSVLAEVRSAIEAGGVARLRKIDKKSVPRFAVWLPQGLEGPMQPNLLRDDNVGASFNQERTIFLGNVPPDLSDGEIRSILGEVHIANRFISRAVRIEGQILQYVLAEYNDSQSADAIIALLNGREIHGLSLKAEKYKPRRRGGKRRSGKKFSGNGIKEAP